MKKVLIAIIAVLIVGAAAVITCPDKQAHKDAIMAVVNEKINEELYLHSMCFFVCYAGA